MNTNDIGVNILHCVSNKRVPFSFLP